MLMRFPFMLIMKFIWVRETAKCCFMQGHLEAQEELILQWGLKEVRD
jgi:hypothetical protein